MQNIAGIRRFWRGLVRFITPCWVNQMPQPHSHVSQLHLSQAFSSSHCVLVKNREMIRWNDWTCWEAMIHRLNPVQKDFPIWQIMKAEWKFQTYCNTTHHQLYKGEWPHPCACFQVPGIFCIHAYFRLKSELQCLCVGETQLKTGGAIGQRPGNHHPEKNGKPSARNVLQKLRVWSIFNFRFHRFF